MRFVTLLLTLFAFLLCVPAAQAAPPPKTPAKTAVTPPVQPKSPQKPAPSSRSAPRAVVKREEEDESAEEGGEEDDDSEEEPPAEGEEEDDDSEEEPAAEDDEEDGDKTEKKSAKGRENYFRGLWKGVTGQRNSQVGQLQAEIEDLKAQNKSLRKENKRQVKQLAYFDDNWDTIEAALTQGNAEDPVLQTKLGKKVAGTVMKTAAQQMKNSGHDPKKLSGPGAAKPEGKTAADGDKKLTAVQLIQLGLQQHREKQAQN